MRLHTRPLVLVAACLLGAPISELGLAYGNAQSPQRESWQSIAKLPDWSGIWDLIIPAPNKNDPPSLTAPYEARFAATKAAAAKGGGLANIGASCLPPGMPGIMGVPYPIEFLFSPGQVVAIIEMQSQVRHIYTDGRPHPGNFDANFNGHSTGHWEGETLVVDTIGILPNIPLDQIGDFYNFLPIYHGDQLHIQERIRLTGANELTDTLTVTDPKALAKPWTYSKIRRRTKNFEMQEYVCEQNNRDAVDSEGRPSIRITPP